MAKPVLREWQFARHRRYAPENSDAHVYWHVHVTTTAPWVERAELMAKKEWLAWFVPANFSIKSGMLRNGFQNTETRKRVMLRNLLFTAAVTAIVAPVVMTADAMAGSSTSTEIGKRHVRSAAHSTPQHHHQFAARRTFTRGFNNDAAAYYSVRPNVSVFRGPGYVYVPRKGIVDEACNLPTSACPNELRDVQ